MRFAATVEFAGVDHTLVCHTRDISNEGCFLDTAELVAEGVVVVLSVMDNHRGEVVSVRGRVARSVDGQRRGVGVRLVEPPPEWLALVQRYRQAGADRAAPAGMRLSILVIGEAAQRRGAMALYVTSGWDVRFAEDLRGAREALGGVPLDAVIVERPLEDEGWPALAALARSTQPAARRIVRASLAGKSVPASGPGELVHRFVDADDGLDALLDALTADLFGSAP